jgi:hypothetical protein
MRERVEARRGVVSLRGGGRDFGQRRTGGRSGAGLLRGVHAWVLVPLLPHPAPPLPARARAWEVSPLGCGQ